MSVAMMPSSDSSMVDENAKMKEVEELDNKVQIPLWSMKTMNALTGCDICVCSDSSMVDENGTP